MIAWATRQKYRFVVIGYVVMPEHFHLLITAPDVDDPSVVMKVIKERFTKLLHHGGVRTGPIWQKRFYDFNVATLKKRTEKLRYMHRNLVKRGLAEKPEDWAWSTFRAYAFQQVARVRVNCQEWPLTITYSLFGPTHSNIANEWAPGYWQPEDVGWEGALVRKILKFLYPLGQLRVEENRFIIFS